MYNIPRKDVAPIGVSFGPIGKEPVLDAAKESLKSRIDRSNTNTKD